MTRQRIIFRIENLEDRLAPSTGIALLDSWILGSPTQYAKAISGYDVAAGPSTTWPNYVPPGAKTFGSNTTPVTADMQQISYSNNWVYVRGAGFASYVMGPWFFSDGSVFPNFPSNQNKLVRITRSPTPASSHTANNLGSVGIWDNGVSMFNMLDGFSWSLSSQNDQPTGKGGDGYWNRDANAAEGPTFDHSHAHQPPSGEYHYHANPTGLRALLGDNIAYTGNGSTTFPNDPNLLVEPPLPTDEHPYHESTTNLHHSPILGWSYDGYPVYGPYGYSNPNDPSSAVVRMTSGYRLRNITTRTTLPGWAAKAKFGDNVSLNANGEYPLTAGQYGPPVSAAYPLGWYTEDYEYVPGLGTLDSYNGRFTKTPEFPNGTYAYFINIDANGEEQFPYIIGRQYYGMVTSGSVGTITESTTTFFNINTPPVGGAIHGVVYTDADASGSRSFSELGLAGATVFVDANNDGMLNNGEINAKTGADGSFELPVTASGQYTIRAIAPAGMHQTTSNHAVITVSGGNAVNGLAFGMRANPPTVAGVQLNDGSIQRSTVTSLDVTFSEAVTFPDGLAPAFHLDRIGGGSPGSVNLSPTQSGNVVTLTFSNGGSVGLDGPLSLPDGRYQLTIVASHVQGVGGAMAADSTSAFYRLFGDADGNGTVNTADFLAFRSAFGAASAIFDIDGNGTVDAADFLRFRGQFGNSLP